MSGDTGPADGGVSTPARRAIDTTVAHSARVHDSVFPRTHPVFPADPP